MKEALIIEGCKSNNRKAQRAFVEVYSGHLFNICNRYMIDESRAKDALQESLLHILNKITLYKDEGSFKSWISTITIRKNLEIIRREKRKWIEDLDAEQGLNSPAKINYQLEVDDVMTFIKNLPYKYRIAINMYLVEGYSHKEIAQELDINEGSSRSLVSRGRQMIRAAFPEYIEKQETKQKKNTFKIAL